MCHCNEHKLLSAVQVRRPEQKTALNAKTEQFITAKNIRQRVTLDYYHSIFVTLILSPGVRDPVFKNKKSTFLQLQFITKTTLKICLTEQFQH